MMGVSTLIARVSLVSVIWVVVAVILRYLSLRLLSPRSGILNLKTTTKIWIVHLTAPS